MTAMTSDTDVIRGRLAAGPNNASEPPRWHLTVGQRASDAGPAGVATLSLPSGLRASFDYQYPDRLLSVEIPCLDDNQDLPPGAVDDEDLEAVASLIGDDATAAMQQRIDSGRAADGFEAAISRTDACRHAGRAALIRTYLADLSRPVDGLWAAEIARLLSAWGTLAALPTANHLAHVAAPALRLLDPAWATAERVREPLAARLLTTLLGCQAVAPRAELGPLLPALREVFAPDMAELERWLRELALEQPDAHQLAVAGQSSSAATTPELLDEGRFEVRLDHSLLGWIAGATAYLDGSWAVVRAQPGPLLAATLAGRRITTRVVHSDDAGTSLVSFGSTMDPEADGTLTTRLPVSADHSPAELVAILGRHLPIGDDRGTGAFERRQATHHARRLLDARRRGDVTAERLAETATALALSGDAERGGDLLASEVPEGFLAETVPVLELLDLSSVATFDDAEKLAAARSLVWQAVPSRAARIEAARIATGSATGALTLPQLDALLFETLARGNFDAATPLDEEADRLLRADTPTEPERGA